MNHSIDVICDYVCLFYGITSEQIKSPSRKYELVRARQMVILLAGIRRDRMVGRVLGRDRSTQVQARKTAWYNMRYDKNMESEFKSLKKGLLYYEIA